MNALLRAKYEWELVNARRVENLVSYLGAACGVAIYLAWRLAGLAVHVLFGGGNLHRLDFCKVQELRKFR